MILIETPRDGWQGINKIIPAKTKIEYINTLLKVGFDIIETGSFVSPKAIPQLADTAEVMEKINVYDTKTAVMVLVGNQKGLDTALKYPQIKYISYPFSISKTFLYKNLNTTPQNSRRFIENMAKKCFKHNKIPVIYLTMAFGNPYGDEWNMDILVQNIKYLQSLEIERISFTDVTGISDPDKIKTVFSIMTKEFSDINFGLHLHTDNNTWYEKIDVAYKNGCRTFDSVINGYGGCPMTGKQLLGNLDTSNLLAYINNNNEISKKVNLHMFREAQTMAKRIFGSG